MSGISERNPFVGPRPIQRGEMLHGRDTEVRELYHRLQARRIVVLHSPSGAGKSSLVQAGLIPQLEEGGYDVWKPIRVNFDPTGLEDLPRDANRHLLSAMVSLEDELPPRHRRGPAALAKLDFLAYLATRPRRKGRSNRPVVLIFDQFEEVLTAAPLAVDARRKFFTVVGRALENENYWALFLIREDYLAAFAPYRDRIPTQMSNTLRLDFLGLQGAREAAEKLAAQGGRSFPGVDRLVRDLSMVQVQQADGSFVAEQGLYVEPVQLQVVCRRLWDAMPADNLSIDAEDIEAYASVSAALGSYYSDAVRSIARGDVAVERAIRDWVGHKLVVGGIRSQVRQEPGRSAGLDHPLIGQLLDSYLVRSELRAGAQWFELSHDRLVEPIQKDNEAWEQAHFHPLQAQAKLWEAGRRPSALLLSAEVLTYSQSWARNNPTLLTESEREFLELSREQRARDRAARRRLVALAIVAVVVAVVVGVLGVVALWAREKAVEAETDAVAQRDAAQRAEETAKEAEAEAVAQRNAAKKAEDLAKRAEDAAIDAKKQNELLLQDMFRAALRRFIVDLAGEGSLSGEVVVDERWTPLLEWNDQRFAASTVVKGGGRIIVAGHDAVLRLANKQGYSVFLEMTTKWLLGEREQDRIVIISDKAAGELSMMVKNLDTLGYQHVTNPPLDELMRAGMLVIDNRHRDFSIEESDAIKRFIRGGGGVLAVGVGWAWLRHKPAIGRDTPTIANYPMNRLLREFGAEWNERQIEGLEKPKPRPTVKEELLEDISVECLLDPSKCKKRHTSLPPGAREEHDDETIRAGVRKADAKSRCASKAKGGEEVQIELSISGLSGLVVSSVVYNSAGNNPLAECVARALKSAFFVRVQKEQTDKIVTVSF